MKILAFNGSPRTNGNTRQLIDICLKPLQEKGYDTEITDAALAFPAVKQDSVFSRTTRSTNGQKK